MIAGTTRSLIQIAACVFFCLLPGCNVSTRPEYMAPTSVDVRNRFSNSISIHVAGGIASTFSTPLQVSNTDFQSALSAAIVKSGLFSNISDDAKADYVLLVSIDSTGGHGGSDIKSIMNSTWEMRSTHSGAIVWKDIISSENTATMGDAFAGFDRARLAVEGAVRKNIKSGIEEISALKLE